MKKIIWVLFINISYIISTEYEHLSALEKDLLDKALEELSLELERHPFNKPIGRIFIVSMPPFSSYNNFNRLLNGLHINTKDALIRSGIFIKPGDIYDESLIRDSELYLRSQTNIRSLALIVTVKGQNNEVDLLVLSKDIISLKPNFDIKGSGIGYDFSITNLFIAFGEHNLLGMNQSILGSYELEQGAHIASMRYVHPHFLGSLIKFYIRPSLVWLRTGHVDGFLGDIGLEKPLLYETDRFGYGILFNIKSRTITDFLGNKVRLINIADQKIAKKYRYEYAHGSLFGKYSMGRKHKYEWLFGYGLIIKNPSVLDEDKDKEAYFVKHILPRKEKESFLILGFTHFSNNFLTLYNYNTYNIAETMRLGASFSISNDIALTLIGSDANFLRPELKFTYTQAIKKDGFISMLIKSQHRLTNIWTDNLSHLSINMVWPRINHVGRLLSSHSLAMMINDRDHNQFYLGNNNGLRGVINGFYSGVNLIKNNIELRFNPINLWGIDTGIVAFYDVGCAFNDFHKINPTHTVGLGLRILALAFSSSVFRIDFPILTLGEKYHHFLPSFGSNQAF